MDQPLVKTVEPTESELRVELAAAYRLAYQFGWDYLIYNHITVRVPGPENHFLINPFGLTFDEITASNLLKIDADGKVVGGPPDAKVSETGFVIHGAIHAAREDLACVMHIHTVAGIAISSIEPGVLTFSQDNMMFHGRVAYHDFEGLAFDLLERKRLLDDMGEMPVLILRNHGLLTAAPTIAGAFIMMYALEHACRSQVALLSMGQKISLPLEEVCKHTAGQYWSGKVPPQHFGQDSFAALMRRLDRTDPSFRN
jgi:ribulose-5-phosphate 4-epimerase/fuculose-1-phosphate aldolase